MGDLRVMYSTIQHIRYTLVTTCLHLDTWLTSSQQHPLQ